MSTQPASPEDAIRQLQARMDTRDGVSTTDASDPGSPASQLFWLKQQQTPLQENQGRFGLELATRRRGPLGWLEAQVKRVLRRLLRSYTKPQREFNQSVSRFLGQSIEYLESMNAELIQLRAENAALRAQFELPDVTPIDYSNYLDRVHPTTVDGLRPFVGYFDGLQRVAHLGCADGQMVRLLGEAGVACYGVTSSPGWAAACRTGGLEVHHEEILDHLNRLSTIDGIFLTRRLESLDRLAARDLLRLTAARLSVGGTLVVQVSNPLNESAARSFHRHPEHRFPLDPELLRYLGESAGLTFLHLLFSEPENGQDAPATLQLETVLDHPEASEYRSYGAVFRKLDQQ